MRKDARNIPLGLHDSRRERVHRAMRVADGCGAARRGVAVSARGADPFQQPLQKRGGRGGCDDPNTSQWKWHTGQAWPARRCYRRRRRRHRHRRRRCSPTRGADDPLDAVRAYVHAHVRADFVRVYLESRRRRGEGEAATDWLLIRNYGNALHIARTNTCMYTYIWRCTHIVVHFVLSHRLAYAFCFRCLCLFFGFSIHVSSFLLLCNIRNTYIVVALILIFLAPYILYIFIFLFFIDFLILPFFIL